MLGMLSSSRDRLVLARWRCRWKMHMQQHAISPRKQGQGYGSHDVQCQLVQARLAQLVGMTGNVRYTCHTAVVVEGTIVVVVIVVAFVVGMVGRGP